MKDPYEVLGIQRGASDDEIKKAYRAKCKRWHPDLNPNDPTAEEHFKEVQEAYDAITAQRKAGGGQGYNGAYNNVGANGSSGFNDVRSLIMSGRIADAEQILNGVPPERRNAEWYFLKGSVLYRRGWLEEAKDHFSRACQMDPGNPEYQAALNQAMNQGSGVYGGYRPNANMNAGGCNSCDVCSSLICADCCCECMGGDLISCC